MTLRTLFVVALAITASACGSTYSAPSAPTSMSSNTGGGAPVSIVMGASTLTTTAFAPNTVTIAAGGSVTWTNNDTVTHTSTANNGSWNSGSIAPGGSFTATLTTPGSYTYHCAIHPGMVGTVTVQ